jgi:hypothetical protein
MKWSFIIDRWIKTCIVTVHRYLLFYSTDQQFLRVFSAVLICYVVTKHFEPQYPIADLIMVTERDKLMSITHNGILHLRYCIAKHSIAFYCPVFKCIIVGNLENMYLMNVNLETLYCIAKLTLNYCIVITVRFSHT